MGGGPGLGPKPTGSPSWRLSMPLSIWRRRSTSLEPASNVGDQEYQGVNVLGTRPLAEQAAAASVKRFVFLSSVKVHGESGLGERSAMAPADSYGASKQDGEDALRDVARRTGIELAIIRAPLVCGPGSKPTSNHS